MSNPNLWPTQDVDSLNAFYGNPDPSGAGVPDPSWEAQNIVRVAPPYPLVLAWNPAQPVKTISIHKKCADSILCCLSRIHDEISASDILKYELDHYGGAYMFRMMRGAARMSVHSWGAAIDLSTAINSFGARLGSKPNMMPQAVADIFSAEGWVWGAPWQTADAQHFQAALV